MRRDLAPGLYFAINSPEVSIGKDIADAASVISSWGFNISAEEIREMTKNIGESSILSHAVGRPLLRSV